MVLYKLVGCDRYAVGHVELAAAGLVEHALELLTIAPTDRDGLHMLLATNDLIPTKDRVLLEDAFTHGVVRPGAANTILNAQQNDQVFAQGMSATPALLAGGADVPVAFRAHHGAELSDKAPSMPRL